MAGEAEGHYEGGLDDGRDSFDIELLSGSEVDFEDLLPSEPQQTTQTKPSDAIDTGEGGGDPPPDPGEVDAREANDPNPADIDAGIPRDEDSFLSYSDPSAIGQLDQLGVAPGQEPPAAGEGDAKPAKPATAAAAGEEPPAKGEPKGEPTDAERLAAQEQENRILRARLRAAPPGQPPTARPAAPPPDAPKDPGARPKFADFDGSIDDYDAAVDKWTSDKVAFDTHSARAEIATKRTTEEQQQAIQQANTQRLEQVKTLVPDWSTKQANLAVRSPWAPAESAYPAPALAYLMHNSPKGAEVAAFMLNDGAAAQRLANLPGEQGVWMAVAASPDADKIVEHLSTAEGARAFDKLAGLQENPGTLYMELGRLSAALTAPPPTPKPKPASQAPRPATRPRGRSTRPKAPVGQRRDEDLSIGDLAELDHQRSVERRLSAIGVTPAV